MSENQKYTVQQRLANFAQATRQNLQMLPSQSISGGQKQVQFALPKARLLSKIMIDFEATINLKHASSTSLATDKFTPYKLINRLSLDLNNGFNPYVIGGEELAIYNSLRLNPEIIEPQATSQSGLCYVPANLTSSSTGTDNTIKFTVPMPICLNDRDLIGMILLQSSETNVNLIVDIASDNMVIDNATGYTATIKNLTIRPCLETFSIPNTPAAYPDLSVLKLVNSRKDTFAGAGQNIVKLATQTIYRKLAFYVKDANGTAFEDSDFSSNIELVFNQADINYSVDARTLRHYNILQFGHELPKGVYVFDFSYNGTPNYGGTRDYINANDLNEFWLRFSTSKAGTVSTVSECLAQLV